MSTDGAADAHRSAVMCAVLGVVGTGMGVPGFWPISTRALHVVQVVGIIINGGALWVLRSRRTHESANLSKAIYLLVLVPTVAMVWLADEARAVHSARWVPYEPNKLSALALAMIAPPGWRTGTVAILMFVGSALVHHVLLSDDLRARMSAGEPFGIIAYGTFALVLLAFKQRSRGLQSALDGARAEKVAVERVARVAMSLRDLANTSVQTLELIRAALLTSDPRPRQQAERMGRSLERLRRLNDILRPYQDAVKWEDADHLSHDSEAQVVKSGISAATPRAPRAAGGRR